LPPQEVGGQQKREPTKVKEKLHTQAQVKRTLAGTRMSAI
jgi:hypothetical protein